VVESAGAEAGNGFHEIHIDDEEGINVEDDHSGDAWHLLAQALSSDRTEDVEKYIHDWLGAITSFLDGLLVQNVNS
jgi:hypothetical protein